MAWIYSFLFFMCTVFRIRCNKPRLPPGTASMSPFVIRERLERLHCERYRYHQGRCEAKLLNPDPREEDESESWQ
jgi:hypothetical protein